MPEVHSRFGYSAVSTFEQCPYRYKLQYLDGLKTIPTDDPANALIIGTALHKAIETDLDTAIAEYFASYPIITDQHIDEEIKLRYLIPKVKEILPEGTHEVQVVDTNFIGTLDMLVPVGNGWYDLYDFKYSNNWLRYMDSRQLHLYKYYFEKRNPEKKIDTMRFVFVPKVQIRQKKTEDLFQFRQRLVAELDKVQPKVEPVEYDPNKVIEHLELTQQIMQCEEFPKNPTNLCGWCEHKRFCQEGSLIDMALPSIERVALNATNHKKIWIYGSPFSGKTTVCDAAPTPLNLNTDGNVKTVTMARLPIKDTMEGRQKKMAWEVFKEAIDELESGSDFETVVVDLLEDTYESCRLWMYKQMGITHESDDSFRAWDKVRTEFLSTIRRLMNLPYNVILISHEDMSKDITKRSGDKITAIKPNIQDKIANKLAGMVDIVCRVLVEDDGRYLSFKSDQVVFGGGRLKASKTMIPLSWEAIEDFYGHIDACSASEQQMVRVEKIIGEGHSESKVLENYEEDCSIPRIEPNSGEVMEQPKRRTRRTRG